MMGDQQSEAIALLSESDVGRLLTAHIRAFQDRRISQGGTSTQFALETVAIRHSGNIASLSLDEATFAIDSLALLDLVMEATRFFNLQDTGIEDYLFVRRKFGDWVDLISDHFGRVGTAARLTFRTSGSTGTPKDIVKSAEHLLDEARSLADELAALELSPGRIISTVAPQHLYGAIWSVFLAKQLGRDVVDRYKCSPLGTGRASAPGDIVLATPYLWEKMADFAVHFAPGCLGVSSGGPATEETFDAARRCGIKTLIEVYGATETGGIGLRNAASETFELLPHLGRDGQTVIRRADQTPLDLQDEISWTENRRFEIHGRHDTVVQIAGTNVDLKQVTQLIKNVPAVDDVAIRLDGKRLRAFVVARNAPQEAIVSKIRVALQALPAAARPNQITFGSALPLSETGKHADW